jgi:hypothetical protein
VLIVLKPVSLNLLEPFGPVQASNGIALSFTRPYENTAHFCTLSSTAMHSASTFPKCGCSICIFSFGKEIVSLNIQYFQNLKLCKVGFFSFVFLAEALPVPLKKRYTKYFVKIEDILNDFCLTKHIHISRDLQAKGKSENYIGSRSLNWH